MKRRYLTPREYAARHGCHINSVMKWIHVGLIPAAWYRHGRQRVRYLVPASAQPPSRKPGPPKSPDTRMRENTRLLLRVARLLKSQADVLDAAGLLPDPRHRLKDGRKERSFDNDKRE